MKNSNSVGFIGCGKMAEAIIRGIISSGTASAKEIYISDIATERTAMMNEELGVNVCTDNSELVKKSEVIVLSIKPNTAAKILGEVGSLVKEKLVVSIMAGKTVSFIQGALSPSAKVIRVMPNSPATLSQGMSAICGNSNVTNNELEKVEAIFLSVGKVLRVEEEQMDVVTAVSGSGPAYLFQFAEWMISAGVKHGLDYESATTLVKQTLLGAATLMDQAKDSPSQLRKNVSCKGGTTLAGLSMFYADNTGETVDKVILSAKSRAIELSKEE